jgi:hypothetical protein
MAQQKTPPVSERSLIWWVFFMPGSVILWFQYMFPTKFVDSIASARRRNVPSIQLAYTLAFYALMAFLMFAALPVWTRTCEDTNSCPKPAVASESPSTALARAAPTQESKPPAQAAAVRPDYNKDLLNDPLLQDVAERLGIKDPFFKLTPDQQLKSIHNSQSVTAKQLNQALAQLQRLSSSSTYGSEQRREATKRIDDLTAWQADLTMFANALERNSSDHVAQQSARAPATDALTESVALAGSYELASGGCCTGGLDIKGAAPKFAVQINTVTKEDQHVCNVETDDAALALAGRDSGTVDWTDSDSKCAIHLAIRGRRVSVSATGDQCSSLCGAGGDFEGDYFKKE